METWERNDCVMSGALPLVLRASRWTGVAPLSFTRLRNGSYKVSTSMPIFIASCTCLMICRVILFGALIYNSINSNEDQSKVERNSLLSLVIIIVITLITIAVNSMGVFGGMKRMKRLLFILRQIQELNIQISYDNSLEPKAWKVWISLILSLILPFFMIWIDLRTYLNDGFVILMTFLVETSPLSLLEIQQVFIIMNINSSVRALNYRIKQLYDVDEINDRENQPNKILSMTKNLRRMNVDTNIPNFDSTAYIDLLIIEGDPAIPTHFEKKSIQNLAQCNLFISNIVVRMFDLDGSLLFLQIGSYVLSIISTVFNFSSALASTSPSSTASIVCQSLWLIYHIVKMTIIIEPSHRLLTQMEKTKSLLSMLLCKLSISNPQRRELGSFFQQFLVIKPSISLIGVCTSNRQLFATILGGVVTFIMIVLQFKLNESD